MISVALIGFLLKFLFPAIEEQPDSEDIPKEIMQWAQRGYCWGYDNDNGPHTWGRIYPKATGAFQSPINIEQSRAEYCARLSNPPMYFNYRELRNCKLVNTGYSFQVSCDSDLATVEGGPLLSRYQFAQFHMHWGSGNGWGSEHALDGRLYPGELHLVHWNSNKFSSFQEASAIKDGLAVVGVFVEIGDAHQGIGRIMQHFQDIQCPDAEMPIREGVNLLEFLPRDRREFFTYEGSLTTPPCFESVRWTVFKQPITMSQEQFAKLRCLRGKTDSGQLVDNYRHLIPLGRRKLLCSCQN